MIRSLLLATALAATACAPAFAKAITLDRNGDGLYQFSELAAAWAGFTKDQFLQIDADRDGALTEAEFLAAKAAGKLPA